MKTNNQGCGKDLTADIFCGDYWFFKRVYCNECKELKKNQIGGNGE